ncbi:hypothetical protein BG006_009393 [Podila minutissima]|uniref:Protein kinase domain-containing protein n=1 Tax=Podila minutissima TaxID=64525 RepID=A0A9P5SIC3_9FUNG|nr:hypothetical protein BG006_009393 [Podila minutissima]
MTDNHRTLFCLVAGETPSNTFHVEIELTKTVSHLKKLIKVEISPRFDNVAAKELTLWDVSAEAIDKLEPIVLNDYESPKKLNPMDDISDVFKETPPSKTIHIIVQRPSPDIISELEFLRCVPGAIIGEQQERSAGLTSSHITVSLSPSPRSWDILDSVRSMELDPTPQYKRPQFMEERIFRPESMLHDLFKHDLGSVNVLPPFAKTTQIMRLGRGVPDLVCLKKDGDPELGESVLFPIEIKRPVLLRSKDLVQDYLAQVRTQSSSKTTSRVTLPDFEKMELISHNERAQTYKASWQGRDVVVKKCDIWNEGPVAEELKNEASVYQKLQTLQGRYIPKLWLAGVADGLEMVLMTDFVGTDVSQELLNDSAQRKIREAMSAIHDLGVVHGDIRPQNIVMQNHGPNVKFYFVDFGFSRFSVDKTELLQETATLNSLLRHMATARPLSQEETGY